MDCLLQDSFYSAVLIDKFKDMKFFIQLWCKLYKLLQIHKNIKMDTTLFMPLVANSIYCTSSKKVVIFFHIYH